VSAGASTRARLGRRAAFVAVAYAFVVTMMGTTLPTPLYPLYQEKLGFSELMVTIVFAVYAFAVIAGLLLFGAASDQLGRRRALLPGLALSAASAVCFLAVGGLGELFAGRVLSGLSAGLFTGTATAALVDLAPPEGRRRATLVATAANIGGLGLGPLVCGLLAEYAADPLRLVFVIDLVLVAIAGLLVFWIPETVDVKPGARLRLQRLGVPAEVRPIFVRAALAAFAGFAILGLFTAVAPAFLAQVLGESSHAVLGIVVAAAFESSLIGQLAVERVGEKRSLPLGCASMVLGMGLLIGGLGAESLALTVLGGICAGIGQGLSFRAGLAAINRDAPPERRAETVSSYFVVAYTALAVPVIGVGVAADAWQLRGAGVAFAAIMATLAATVLISLRDQLRPAAARG
jgi:MFS family permease